MAPTCHGKAFISDPPPHSHPVRAPSGLADLGDGDKLILKVADGEAVFNGALLYACRHGERTHEVMEPHKAGRYG